jgi:hypothetical protein
MLKGYQIRQILDHKAMAGKTPLDLARTEVEGEDRKILTHSERHSEGQRYPIGNFR